MNKSKKYFITLSLVGIFIIPQLAFASWWNPFTWRFFTKKQTPQTQQVIATSTNTQKEDKNNEIDSLKKEISTLKEKVNQPKTQAKIDPPTKPVETPKTITTTVTIASTNPAVRCLEPKKKWDEFVNKLNDIDKKISDLFASYNKSAWGTGNKPTDVVARFSYNYERMSPAKAKFSSDIETIRKTIDNLSQPPISSSQELEKIKKNYVASVEALESAYGLTLSSFKIIADDDDGLSKTEIDSSLALLSDGEDKYNESLSNWKLNNLYLSDYDYRSLKKILNSEYNKNGCSFTFNSNNIIETTISDEKLFIQQIPKSNATQDGNTVVSIETSLPIEINENGSTKTAIKLICNSNTLLVSQISKNVIGTSISRSNSRLQCKFTYNGNGNELSTRMLDFNF